MSNVVISVEGLSKIYRLGAIGGGSLRQDYARWWAKKRGKPDPYLRIGQKDYGNLEGETVWALRDVNLKVRQGEIVGIIGSNGAGKSTLLKILSRITAPTSGEVKIKGRIGSLLEVGTGFHPELTGRENVFLNGAILGMTKEEVASKFDEIVDFSGVEQYIDTPVKRYSSGMMVRLAFAVAAHLEPEILVVDEVLAVGDAEFRKKSIGKLGEVAGEGRTVLFVSHNMAAVDSLCERGVVLTSGKMQHDGSKSSAIKYYINSLARNDTSLRDRTDRKGSGAVRIVGIELVNSEGERVQQAMSGQDIQIRLPFECAADVSIRRAIVSLKLNNNLGVPVFLHHNRLAGTEFGLLPKSGTFKCRFSRLPLPPSEYKFDLSVMVDREYLDNISDAGILDVVEGDYYGVGEVPPSSHGLSLVDAEWSVEPSAAEIVDAP